MRAEKQEDHDLFSCIDGGTPASMTLDFQEFDRANPEVWKLFVRFAFELIEAGHKVLSVSLITERIRWETMVRTTTADFKINNNHRPFYARKFMKLYPTHNDIFRTRRAEADAVN